VSVIDSLLEPLSEYPEDTVMSYVTLPPCEFQLNVAELWVSAETVTSGAFCPNAIDARRMVRTYILAASFKLQFHLNS